MSKQVVTIDGQETLVSEDTAKAFRGVHWALISLAAFILITALLFFAGVIKLTADPPPATDTSGPPPASERGGQ